MSRYAAINPDLAKVVSPKKSKKSLSDNDNKTSITHRKNDTNILDVKDSTFNRQKNSLPENVRASDPALKYSKLDDSKRKKGAKPKTHNRNKESHGKNGSFQPYTVTDFQTKFDPKYVKLGGLGFNKDDRWCDAKNRFDKMK